MPSTIDPRFTFRSWFTGAILPVCGIEVLVVIVLPHVLFDRHESALYTAAFQMRFGRTVVLMAQDADTLAPTYSGPGPIVTTLATLPFEMLPWQRMLHRAPRPQPFMLPIPAERPSGDSSDASDTSRTGCYESSLEDLASTQTRDGRAPQRSAGSTKVDVTAAHAAKAVRDAAHAQREAARARRDTPRRPRDAAGARPSDGPYIERELRHADSRAFEAPREARAFAGRLEGAHARKPSPPPLHTLIDARPTLDDASHVATTRARSAPAGSRTAMPDPALAPLADIPTPDVARCVDALGAVAPRATRQDASVDVTTSYRRIDPRALADT